MLGDWLSILPLVVAVAPVPIPPETQLAAASLAGVYVVSQLGDACPDDMELVDGDFCPSLEYECLNRRHPKSLSCDEYARKPECRHDTTSLRFCIDRYEWPNRPGERPSVYVNWHEAQTQCSSIGKRLCRRHEWTLACEGPKRAPYPHGWSRHPTSCNLDHPRIPVNVRALDDPATRSSEIERLWQAHPIGAGAGCVSAFGARDMVGNVDEWTDNRPEGLDRESTLNGGYWGPVRNTCRLTTRAHGPGFRYYQIGFRCCQDPADGVRPALPAGPTPRWLLERARGPDGWPIPDWAREG